MDDSDGCDNSSSDGDDSSLSDTDDSTAVLVMTAVICMPLIEVISVMVIT